MKIKEQKTQKSLSKKENLTLKIIKTYLEKIKIDIDSIKEFIKNNKSILNIQQRFKSEGHNVFTEEINTISLNSNNDKRILSIDSMQAYEYGTYKDLVSDKEEIKCSNIIK